MPSVGGKKSVLLLGDSPKNDVTPSLIKMIGKANTTAFIKSHPHDKFIFFSID